MISSRTYGSLRHTVRVLSIKNVSKAVSRFSSKLVDSQIDISKQMVTLTMQNMPVNSLSLEMCRDLAQAIIDAEQIREIEGLLLQSNSSTTFSAGIDIREMNKPDQHRLVHFWESFQDLYMTLYGSRLACVAAIEGYALAGGCMLTLCCDYRIMTMSGEKQHPTIGLNETKLGIAAPPWLANQMMDTIGHRKAEISLQLGKVYTPEQALDINLIDEVVPSYQVRERSTEVLQTLIQIPPQARYASKMLVRKSRIDSLKLERQKDIDFFVNFVTQPSTQKKLSEYLNALAAKRKQ